MNFELSIARDLPEPHHRATRTTGGRSVIGEDHPSPHAVGLIHKPRRHGSGAGMQVNDSGACPREDAAKRLGRGFVRSAVCTR